MVWIVHIAAGIANHKAAYLIRPDADALQHVDNLDAKQLADALADARRLYLQIHTELVYGLDDLVGFLANLNVVLQQTGARFARRARHLRHNTVLDLERHLL